MYIFMILFVHHILYHLLNDSIMQNIEIELCY